MESLVALIVVLSAVLHPLWYALIKRDSDQAAALMSAVAGIALIALAHGLVVGVDFFPQPAAWPWMAVSLLGQVAYHYSNVRVLRRGDLSVYYPIVRSSPALIAAIGFFAFDERYAPTLLVGIALVVIGAFALQYRRGGRLLAEPAAFAFSIVALIGSAVYAIADSRVVRYVDPIAALAWIETANCLILGLLFARQRERQRPGLPQRTWAAAPFRYLTVAGLAYASYYLLLLAYRLGGNVAAVNAVRLVAIPVSVIIGGLWLGEGGVCRRLGGALIVAAGVAVIVAVR